MQQVSESGSHVLVSGRRAVAVLLMVAVLTLLAVTVSHPTLVAESGRTAIELRVNWGAVAMRTVAIVGATVVIAVAPAITIPILIAGATGLAAAFDLTYNRCSYGINYRC